VQDLCVVASGGRVLVCPRERAEEVRALVERVAAHERASKPRPG
jgi:hypothetical protein